MKVVTWNIQFGVQINDAISELATIDVLQGIDILLLQEMDEAGTAKIAASLDAGYAYACAAPHSKTGRDFGNAIVSRWPILNSAEIPLPNKAPVQGQPRSATHATIQVDKNEVSAYSVHTEIPALRLARRIEQFDELARDALNRRQTHTIIGGDFNTVTERGVAALEASLRRAGLHRVAVDSGPSYRRGGKAMTLDHVFACGFSEERAGLALSVTASDHVPLWLDLEFETAAEVL